MSGAVPEETKVSVEVKALQVENAQLKAEFVQLKQRMERLEKRLEEALETKRTSLEARSFHSPSSSSSSAFLLHSSSPLLASAVPKSEEKEVEQLLRHVAYGEQDEAEALVQKKSALLLCKGTVTDLSQREFKGITAFQYALWALDWYMWKMLLKYLPKEAAALQFVELEEKGTAYGKHFSLLPLIEALNTYVKNLADWAPSRQHETYWGRDVGKIQRSLPVSIVNEYCNPDRSFEVVPKFVEESLKRSMVTFVGDLGVGDMEVDVGHWYTGTYQGYYKIGEGIAYVRCKWAKPIASLNGAGSDYVKADAEAMRRLWEVRQQQRDALKAALIYSPAINSHLPPVLTEIVVSYLADEDITISAPGM